jgi:aminopeptidase N
MRDGQPHVIYLKDYQAPDYLIEHTTLDVDLGEEVTRVRAVIRFNENPEGTGKRELTLDGGKDLDTRSIAIDGRQLSHNEYKIEGETLTLFEVPEQFVLETEVLIKPQENMALSGLYKSGDMFCTQCEAEGFRHITWYLDRPDVLSEFETTITADKAAYPVLLSNGNAVAREDLGDRHRVTWRDPFLKPAYLYALVAGDLEHIEDHFVTMSGRRVTLQIFTEAHNIDKVDFAMESLKTSMRWDEEVYGREYDLDIFMIVAVDSFNMGAMENKGLNIFNTSCVLAHPETTTDAAFQRVESVVAHEYFHNWSGNRVTCRDWFQLSLKEGFTVLRDQQFSCDQWSPSVCRIEQVQMLRSAQFPEDAGPMAHPIRPPSFIEINNFYTATVYEKGAEVVGMLATLLGPDTFRRGTDLYFERHDGQAVTTEDFVQAMIDASGADLDQFQTWYHQAGTPVIEARGDYDAAAKTYTLTLRQSTPPTPGQKEKQPLHMPITLGLVGEDGLDLAFEVEGHSAREIKGHDGYSRVLELRESEQVFVLSGVASKPVPSVARHFSAPVKLNIDYSLEELAFLSRHDSDGFNRWEAGQRLAIHLIDTLERGDEGASRDEASAMFLSVMTHHLKEALNVAESDVDGAGLAYNLSLPGLAFLGELRAEINVDSLVDARNAVRRMVADRCFDELSAVLEAALTDEPFVMTAKAVGRRALVNVCLDYLLASERDEAVAMAERVYRGADNMTLWAGALRAVVGSELPSANAARAWMLEDFYTRGQKDALVMDLWFSIQAASGREGAVERVKALMAHPDYTLKNPNRMRSVLGAFAGQNVSGFHESTGAGYAVLADTIIKLDRFNPQMAARMLGPLTRWRKYDALRRELMKAALEKIQAQAELSPDVFEVVGKSLSDA